MKKKIIISLIIIVIVTLAIFFIFSGDGKKSDKYRTQRVTNSPLRIAVSATGTLNPVMVVNVGTQVSGTIREIMVDFNDQVTEGQLLLVLDDELFQARASITRANLTSVEAQLRLAQQKYDRQLTLFRNHSSTQEDLDTALANLDIAKATVAQQKASLDTDLYNLKNTRIISPVSGVVINKDVTVGQTVAASFQTPTLIDIAQDLTKMQINASFAEADIGRLKPGLEASFTVDTYPGENFKGQVRQIRLNPTTTSNVVTYDVVVDVNNPDLKLLPGMTAYVDIELFRQDNALLIPNTALSFRPATEAQHVAENATSQEPIPSDNTLAIETHGQVYVLGPDKKLRMIPLTLGATDLRSTVIKEGNLNPGDLVVIGETSSQNTPIIGARRF